MANGNLPSGFSGSRPDTTPIADLGITAAAAAHLTDAAKELKKGDLVALREHRFIAKDLQLHVKDIDSIRVAFSHATEPTSPKTTLGLSSGCCCTPCCCAASALTRDTKVA